MSAIPSRSKTAGGLEPGSAKQRINLTVDAGLIERARAAGLNVSQIAEAALVQRLREEDGRRWLEENREAIAVYNDFVRRNGMWSDGVRKF